MAWTTDNPVTVGNPTKKKDFDTLWNNAVYLRTNVISSGTVMLFAQNAPPTGWTRKAGWTPGSGYANIVYSSGQCTTGGAKAATTDIVHTIAAHNHMWYSTGGGTDKVFNSAGAAQNVPTHEGAGNNCIALNAGSTGLGGDCYTNNASLSPSKTTAFKYIAVIAATKDKYVP